MKKKKQRMKIKRVRNNFLLMSMNSYGLITARLWLVRKMHRLLMKSWHLW